MALSQAESVYTLKKLNIQTADQGKDSLKTAGLIPFKKGDKLTISEIENTINKLIDLELIKSIDHTIDYLPSNEIRLNVTIHEFRTVRGIKVRGNYPFLSKEIRRLIPLQPGTVFEESKILESQQAVERFLEKNGYYESKVKVSYKYHKKYPVVDLKINIKRGHFYRVGNIKIKGNTVFFDSRIKNKISRSSRFRENRLKKEIREIRKLYNDHGYIKTRVKLTRMKFDHKNKKVHLRITIRENKELVLKFTGNKVLSSIKLQEISNLSEGRTYDRYAIERAEKRLIKYYKLNGYPFVQIESNLEKNNDQVFITFNIEANQRVDLSQIKFVGNDQISDGKLEKVIESEESKLFSPGIYNEDLLLEDQKRIYGEYLKKGFFDAEVSEPKTESNDFGDKRIVKFLINEGKPYKIRDVIFYGLPDESLLFTQKLPLRRGTDFRQDLFVQTKEKILENLYELGYAYADMKIRVDKYPNEKEVDLIYEVTAGPKSRVRNIIIKGNHKTKVSIIKQNLEFKSGDLFNYQKLLNSQLNLRRLGIFRTVRVQALGYEDQAHEVDILVRVFERNTIRTNFQVGYDNRSSIRGEVNFTKRNFLGLAKQIHTRFIGGLTFNRFETTFSAPRIFGADINLANQYFIEYDNGPIFNAVSYGGFVSTLKNLSPRWTIGARNQVTRTDIVQTDSDIVSQSSAIFDNTLNEFRVFAYFDARDNFADPNKGVYLYANNELNTELTNLKNNFTTLELGISHHKKLTKRFTFNQTLRYSQIFALTNEASIPFNELLFIGGSDTVRGFNEDSIKRSGGNLRLIYNAELHFLLFDAFKLAAFFDTGMLETDWTDVNADAFRESAGVGLRYFTPVGPIRLDYGFVLDPQAGESSRFHFSFGYFF